MEGGKKVHGNIQTIEADRFTLLPDQQTAVLPIAYGDVWQVEPNLNRAGVIIGVIVAVVVLAVIVWVSMLAKSGSN